MTIKCAKCGKETDNLMFVNGELICMNCYKMLEMETESTKSKLSR